MLVIDTKSTDPYFNLACEEYFFRNFNEEILFLYINSPAIIIGKHQNAYEEVNLEYIKNNKVPLIRRISGGGTVYHDEGNLNFTFIRNREDGRQVSFIEHTRPIISFFEKHGLSPYVGDKNEIREDGLKFSGNAEHVFKNRVLHHGTILFASDLTRLRKALKKGKGRYISRSVQSNRTNVGNLSTHLKNFTGVTDLKTALEKYITDEPGDFEFYNLSSDDSKNIYDLVLNKYNSEEWNFAYGPDYKFRNTFEFEGSIITVELGIKGGVISNCSIEGEEAWKIIAEQLIGEAHILEAVSRVILINFPGVPDGIVYSFFN